MRLELVRNSQQAIGIIRIIGTNDWNAKIIVINISANLSKLY